MLKLLQTASLPAMLTIACSFLVFSFPDSAKDTSNRSFRISLQASTIDPARLEIKANLALAFAKKAGFNTQVCFLADMRAPSGKKRFLVYDLQLHKIMLSGLVAHGCGSQPFSAIPEFSNQPNSYCTSEGRYKIGKAYWGKFGRSYSLQGLDKTNDQALFRHIVLHAYACVPECAQDYPICNSLGCPMLSPAFFAKLERIIDRSKKPILLWIYR